MVDKAHGLLGFDDALAVVRRLVVLSEERGQPIGSPIVLVGGSAMAARGVRALSADVDLWTPSFSDDVVHEVEDELRTTWGALVKLDVTSTENLWGPILLRDIASSPVVAHVGAERGPVEVRALAIEDLYLLKLSAARTRDLDDLTLLAPRTSAARLVDRFNQLAAWHGDRGAVLGFADAFVTRLVADFGADATETISRLRLAPYMLEALRESHASGV